MEILIKNVKKTKTLQNKTFLHFTDGSSMAIAVDAENLKMYNVVFENKTLIIFKKKSKPRELIVTGSLRSDFGVDIYSPVLRREYNGKFSYCYTTDGSFYLKYYYGGNKAIDYREGSPQEVIIPKY